MDYKDSVHVTVETTESRVHSVGWWPGGLGQLKVQVKSEGSH